MTGRLARVIRKLISTVVVLLVLLVIADRVMAAIAGRALASELEDRFELSERPDVTVHGFPFLTQVVDGSYDDIEISAADLRAANLPESSVRVHLRGAGLSVSEALKGELVGVPVDRVTGEVTVPYETLAERSGMPGLQISPRDDGQLDLTGQATVLGQTRTVDTTGEVAVQDGDLVISSPEGISFRVEVGALPFGLQLEDVEVADDGLRVTASASEVTLTPDLLR